MVEQNKLRTMNKENGKRIKKSNKKLKDLGWEITVSFDEGIKMLV